MGLSLPVIFAGLLLLLIRETIVLLRCTWHALRVAFGARSFDGLWLWALGGAGTVGRIICTTIWLLSEPILAQTAGNTAPITVVATALGPAPGAIVCPDMNCVGFMFDWFADRWQDSMTDGQSRLIRQAPSPEAALKSFDCTLVKPGTKMSLVRRTAVPIVTVKMPNGKIIKGVTLGDMFQEIAVDRDDERKERMARQSPLAATKTSEPLGTHIEKAK
jgi:hypothetical protein